MRIGNAKDFPSGSTRASLLEEPHGGLSDISANELNGPFVSRLVSTARGLLMSTGTLVTNSSMTVV